MDSIVFDKRIRVKIENIALLRGAITTEETPYGSLMWGVRVGKNVDSNGQKWLSVFLECK